MDIYLVMTSTCDEVVSAHSTLELAAKSLGMLETEGKEIDYGPHTIYDFEDHVVMVVPVDEKEEGQTALKEDEG